MTYVRCINNQTLWQDDPAQTDDPHLIRCHVYKIAPPQKTTAPPGSASAAKTTFID